MPIGLIGTGLSLLGSAIDRNQERKGRKEQNKQNTRNAREERAWNLQQWHRQNSYNSPQQQMSRLTKAGLNPNLIYGNGSTSAGNAGDVKGYSRQEATNVDEGHRVFGEFNNFRNTSVQTDNLEKQNEVLTKEATLKAIEAQVKAQSLKGDKFDYGLKKQLRDNSVEAAMADTDKKVADAKVSFENASSQKIFNSQKVKKYKAELKLIGKNTDGKQTENALKQLELKMLKEGYTKSDNLIFRLIMSNPNLKSLFKNNGFNGLPF